MFAPTKTWRKWHVKINQNQRRYAVASALAASALPSLVLARGHRVEKVQEVPLVVSDAAESLNKTKAAVELLKAVKAYADVVKVSNSRKLRAGKGKMRNRRHRQRRGPLVVYNNDQGLVKAFRNIPGVETCNVKHLNLLQLAPGGHMGRFIVWTEGAMNALDDVYSAKSGYDLPTAKISANDVTRIINSDEIQSVVRPAGQPLAKRPFTQKKNPLRNKAVLFRLNPYAKTLRRQELLKLERKRKGKSSRLPLGVSANACLQERSRSPSPPVPKPARPSSRPCTPFKRASFTAMAGKGCRSSSIVCWKGVVG
jgi:large subunit ribosomal protein L4e